MHRRTTRRVAFGTLLALVLAGLAAAGPGRLLTPRLALAQGAPTVQPRMTALGMVLVGSNGRTLYTLSADTPGRSTCADQCATAWPPLVLDTGTPVAAPGLPGRLAIITRADGRRQVTYNDQPLYFFVRDAQPGDTNGEGVMAFGGVWHVVRVTAAGAPPAAPAAPAPQRPAGPVAAPPAQAPAGPVRPAVAPAPAGLPRTGAGLTAGPAPAAGGWRGGLAVAGLLALGSVGVAVTRRARAVPSAHQP
jgi:predicted lipoprotein with Yx(FWY)xxD motif